MKRIIIITLFILCFIGVALLGSLFVMKAVDDIYQKGLKGIVEEIWYGKEDDK